LYDRHRQRRLHHAVFSVRSYCSRTSR
jgi:hypothetical protein